jgi:hypothetical protein
MLGDHPCQCGFATLARAEKSGCGVNAEYIFDAINGLRAWYHEYMIFLENHNVNISFSRNIGLIGDVVDKVYKLLYGLTKRIKSKGLIVKRKWRQAAEKCK